MWEILEAFDIILIIVTVILQFFISIHSSWDKKRKLLLSINLFIVIFIINTGYYFIFVFSTDIPSGIIIFFLFSKVIIVSIFAGFLQIITNTLVWLFKRLINKK